MTVEDDGLIAGWYATPDGLSERWHDGRRWTGVTRPAGPRRRPVRGPMPPGWYETGDTRGLRYYDGRQWTRLTKDWQGRPAAMDSPHAYHRAHQVSRGRSRAKSRSSFYTWLVLGVVGVLIVSCALALTPGGAGDAVRRAIGIKGPQRILPAVVPSEASTSYAFMTTDSSGDPVRYDPCRPIHYAINPDGAPSDYASFIQSAVAAAQTASGLEFVYDGVSSDLWASRQNGTDERPVLIGFSDAKDVPALAEEEFGKHVAGVGGSLSVSVEGRLAHYVTGAVALDRSSFARLSSRGMVDEERAIVMHELGHVLGLAHVADPNQLMFADNVGKTTYGDGDLAGLAIAGDGSCR
ncbi:DUF2510 domain-containing protein [Nocardioides sp. Kera G14]|uniref:DUF2510 domain-containing protein n=1 Tax=Nocardioides sp. Kera G14 TaxID=2884264 RepID=UPI001D115F5A|nr:DUF2510 domain-containing protein [Nocardioides sp. Kera G14]UDY24157.1 DUF2510 domain-containing protein [Nocardioides sp. Kera G14]